MLEVKKQTLSETFSVYYDKRMLRILLLGAISGFPWVLIASSLSLWLKEEGLSRSTIGWAGLIFAVYAFNYLWAPIIGPKPGPTFEMDVAAPERAVMKSRPVKDNKAVKTKKITK